MKAACVAVFATLVASGSTFVIPGPSRVITGRPTRTSTSKVSGLQMGRGDTRTKKGKRHRHSFGICRPRKPGRKEGAPVAEAPAPRPKLGDYEIDLQAELYDADIPRDEELLAELEKYELEAKNAVVEPKPVPEFVWSDFNAELDPDPEDLEGGEAFTGAADQAETSN